MKQTVSKGMFRDAFKACGRGDQFSYEGLGHIYDWLEAGQEGNEEYELDVIALCCEFAESSWDEIRNDYSQFSGLSDEETRTKLEDETVVVWADDSSAIYVQF